MRIAVPSLRSGRQNFKSAVSAADYGPAAAETGLRFRGVIGVDATVTKMNEDMFVHAELSATVLADCARCLEEFELAISTTFEALYAPEHQRDLAGPASHRAVAESQRIYYYSGGVVDLAEQILEALVLAAPMKPLCRPDCKGICPGCGQNLNEGPCSCSKADSFGKPFEGLFGAK